MLDAACLEDHLRTCKLLGPPPFRSHVHGHFGRGLTLRREIGHENSPFSASGFSVAAAYGI